MVTFWEWTAGGMGPRGLLGATPITLTEKTEDFLCFLQWDSNCVSLMALIVPMKVEYNRGGSYPPCGPYAF